MKCYGLAEIRIDIDNCHQRLTKEETEQLHKKYLKAKGRRRLAYRDQLVYSILPWAIQVAARYLQGMPPTIRLDPTDVVQVALIGCIEAVERYAPERGRLTTYATFWIRQSICHCIYTEGSIIRVPEHIRPKVFHGDESVLAEKARAALECHQFTEVVGNAKEGLEEMLLTEGTPLMPMEEEELLREGESRQQNIKDAVEEAMKACLTKQEQDIVLRRFFHKETLLSISTQYGISRERVRQIYVKACSRLKQHLGLRDAYDRYCR